MKTEHCPKHPDSKPIAMPASAAEPRWQAAWQCNACGRRWQRHVRHNLSVRLSPPEHRSIELAAKRDRLPMAAWMREAAVDKAEKKGSA